MPRPLMLASFGSAVALDAAACAFVQRFLFTLWTVPVESRRVAMLIESAHRLLRRGALANVQRLLSKAHEADIALLFGHLTPAERVTVFNSLESRERRAAVLSEVERSLQVDLLRDIGAAEAVAVLEEMDRDDVADLLRALPEEYSEELLRRMRKEESLEVEGLLGYAEDTAGGIMSPEFLALTEDATVEEAIRACRAGEDLEMVFYVYVVNEFGHLVGVVSLRQLVTAGPQTRLRDIMETNVVRVRAGVDSGEVAGLVARYNFLAIPVVDDSNKLIGIVTVDDVIDVIREEATEDVLRMVGAGDDIANSRRVGTNLRARLPWVAVAFLGGLVTVPILLAFGPEHLAPSDFLLFAPLLLSLSGNLGIQSSALVERELASGATPAGIVGRVFAREAAVGALFGLVCGGLAAGIAYLVQGGPFAIAVGGSVAVGLVAATATGTLVGVVAALLGQSTGYTVGPLVKALCDAVVLLVYLLISRSLLHLLLPEA